jgi:hypothetical protein
LFREDCSHGYEIGGELQDRIDRAS